MTSDGWFVLAALALAAGAATLVADLRRRGARARTRRDWAQSRGMRYAAKDAAIAATWSYGLLAHNPSRAVHVTTGEHHAATLHVLDLEQGGAVVAVLVALRQPSESGTVLELRLASSAPPTGAGIDLLGPVGPRYAFTTDLEAARLAVDEQLGRLAQDAGADISVLWGEHGWVLAALSPAAGPQRWEHAIAVLEDLAVHLQRVPSSEPPVPHTP